MSENHFVIYMPHELNGMPLILNALRNAIEHPREGQPVPFRNVHSWDVYIPGGESKSMTIFDEHGEEPVPPSYWFAITKTLHANTTNKSFNDQSQALASGYTPPRIIEAIAAIAIAAIRGDDPLKTYTNCKEMHNNDPLAVGGYTADGIHIVPGAWSEAFGMAGVLRFNT